jgi:hypothetical protein
VPRRQAGRSSRPRWPAGPASPTRSTSRSAPGPTPARPPAPPVRPRRAGELPTSCRRDRPSPAGRSNRSRTPARRVGCVSASGVRPGQRAGRASDVGHLGTVAGTPYDRLP